MKKELSTGSLIMLNGVSNKDPLRAKFLFKESSGKNASWSCFLWTQSWHSLKKKTNWKRIKWHWIYADERWFKERKGEKNYFLTKTRVMIMSQCKTTWKTILNNNVKFLFIMLLCFHYLFHPQAITININISCILNFDIRSMNMAFSCANCFRL